MQVNDLRRGMAFVYENNLFVVLDQTFTKTGRAQGHVKLKVKNMKTGARTELTFTGGDKIEKAIIEKKEMQYLYNDGINAILMDTETYEQIELPISKLEWELNFLIDGAMISMTESNGEFLGIELPDKVELTIAETELAVAGNTNSGAQKKAILITGLEIQVPQFIKSGEKVLISTIDGKYTGRSN
ncbi:elongation factor P [Spiroplasma endosymbiont of Labia minor]|uniref:elongation factor P n=1 Tax=Spiroplasma endosymbiont of Labia minor TaxID=3066305 RepID=UPI0030CB370C